jgi:hypothetical protein
MYGRGLICQPNRGGADLFFSGFPIDNPPCSRVILKINLAESKQRGTGKGRQATENVGETGSPSGSTQNKAAPWRAAVLAVAKAGPRPAMSGVGFLCATSPFIFIILAIAKGRPGVWSDNHAWMRKGAEKSLHKRGWQTPRLVCYPLLKRTEEADGRS